MRKAAWRGIRGGEAAFAGVHVGGVGAGHVFGEGDGLHALGDGGLNYGF